LGCGYTAPPLVARPVCLTVVLGLQEGNKRAVLISLITACYYRMRSYNAHPLVTKAALGGSGFQRYKRSDKLVKLVLARLIRGAIIVHPFTGSSKRVLGSGNEHEMLCNLNETKCCSSTKSRYNSRSSEGIALHAL